MTSRTFATLDRNRCGPLLLLDDSELRFTTATACDINRTIFGTMPAMSGEYAYECYIWSTSQSDLSSLVSVGVATPDSPLSHYVGQDRFSYGYGPANGVIWNENAVAATVQTAPERIALGVHLSLSPGAATCDWLVNRSVIATQTLPTGNAWVPAISLGSASAGDVSCIVNFGQHRFDKLPYPLGWSQQTAGLATIHIALASEGFMSANGAGGLPANTPFGPYVLNSRQICITRSPEAWWHRTGGRTNPAAITTLQLDNGSGTFNALRDADVRDSTVVLQMIDAPPGRGSFAVPVTMFTGIIESVSEPKPGIIEVALRDTLSRFDKPMPMRIVPPFADESSAGRVVPVGLGSQRNVMPMLYDEPNRIYLLGDGPMTNIPLVSDMGAPLDPHALPPQYTPALDGAGIQLETLPEGRLAVDCSSVGAQYEIPGADDAMNGIGAFQPWPPNTTGYTTTPPDGWVFSNYAGSELLRRWSITSVSAQLLSSRIWYPAGVAGVPQYGDHLRTADAVLLGGRSYRLTLKVKRIFSPASASHPPSPGGLMIRTALSDDAADAITPHGKAITSANAGNDQIVVDFRVPTGSPRYLYLIATASRGATPATPGVPGGWEIDGSVKLQLLGQYQDIPIDGISAQQSLTEVLVRRCGEDASVFSAADAAAIDAKYPYPFGPRYEDTPNVLDVMTEIADQFGAIIFTDEFGVVRLRKITDEGDTVAAFDFTNIDETTVRIYPDRAAGLTTLFGARPNCTPFGPGDFVTDEATVTATIKAMYQGPSQFNLSAPVQLAQAYAAAYGAPRRHTRIDDPAVATAAAKLDCGLFGKLRMFCALSVTYQGMTLGNGPSVSPQKLYPGDKIAVTLPKRGLNAQKMTVLQVGHYPDAKKLDLIGWYAP